MSFGITKDVNLEPGKNIYLLGFMGSGKTTVGRLLATQLNRSFIDLDSEIQINEGRTISEIFQVFSESYFRQVEHNELIKQTKSNKIVLACGGGTPCFFDNLVQMQKTGIMVYLKYDFPLLFHRISNVRYGNRPIVTNNSKIKLENLFNQRQVFYESADIIIYSGENSTPESISNLIIEKIGIKL
ncbi:MAG: shikimate kinase [Saprospiraceae bacterium]|nr:shikimate kinase [Saprospiraceae bacterium]